MSKEFHNDILSDLELESKIEKWSEAEKFLARQVTKQRRQIADIEKRTCILEGSGKKILGMGASAGGVIVGIVELVKWLITTIKP